MLVDEAGAGRIAARIAEIERATDAELVTVLAARSDDYSYIPALWAAIVALLVPWGLHWSPLWLEEIELLAIQAVTFIVLFFVLRLPPVLVRVIPHSVRAWRASSLARRQFLEQGLHHTAGETGVLVFVSEAEHYVEILADRGIDRHVEHERWQAIVDAFTSRVRAGETVEGFLECIDACGALLVEHAPATHEKNELPNHLVLI
jgi:putative membrane protein